MTNAQVTMETEQERVQAFAALGFDPSQAVVLAATQEAGEHVDADLVKRLLDGGCSHDLAMRIVL